MGRSPCCSKVGLRRGPWSTKEDTVLADYIQKHGEGQWRALPKNAGLLRCGKSCRLRWMNYLRPGIKRGNISEDEEDLILRLHKLLGNRWSLIAGRLPGRTDNEIKNYWNTHLLKKHRGGVGVGGFNYQLPLPKKNNKKKKMLMKNGTEEQDLPPLDTEEAKEKDLPPPQKVFLPKPIRLSSNSSSSSSSAANFSTRTNSSCDSFSSGSYQPLFEQVDGNADFLNEDVNMWEKVYDEYLQLLLAT